MNGKGDPHDRPDPPRLSDRECYELFDRLFPGGFAGDDVVEELVANGGETVLSTFVATAPETQAPDTVANGPSTALGELVALCLWDVFSENHDVLAADGRIADLGSWRGSADFLADILNAQLRTRRFDYMHFYMGTSGFRLGSEPIDPAPVYLLIFDRLRANGFDWRYSFPQIHLVDLRPLAGEPDGGEESKPEWEGYSPSEAFADEAKRRELAGDLERRNREAIEAARDRPPPATVEAYRKVYGRFPEGWPP